MEVSIARKHESNMGEMQTTNFQMKASAQAFKILSDSLYKNPILAVVRELVANAWDSHSKKGNADVPFIVHTPTELEPYWEITDFGVSMDDEFVHSRYVTFFDSDKDHNNDAIGGFGLGSKAPFAYADQFTLICRLNGRENKYRLLINEQSVYQIVDVSSHNTKSANGVTIRIPVAQKDFDAFREATQKVIEFLPTQPHVNFQFDTPVPFADIELSFLPQLAMEPPTDYQMRHTAIERLLKVKVELFDSAEFGCKAIMGYMPYDIDISQHEKWSALKRCRLHAPIGFFDISPDREGIRFSELTLRRMHDVVRLVNEEFVKRFSSTLNDKKSWYKRAQYATYVANVAHGTVQYKAAKAAKEELRRDMTIPDGVNVTLISIPWRAKQVKFTNVTSDFDWIEIVERFANQRPRGDTPQGFYHLPKRGPYQEHFRDFDTSDLPCYMFTGSEETISAWRKMYDLPEFEVLPELKRRKPSKKSKLNAKFKYKTTFCPSDGELTEGAMSAQELADSGHTPILSLWSTNNYERFARVFEEHNLIQVTVPLEHTRVRHQLVEEVGAHESRYLEKQAMVNAFKASGGKVNKTLLGRVYAIRQHQDAIENITRRASSAVVTRLFNHKEMMRKHPQLCSHRDPILNLNKQYIDYMTLWQTPEIYQFAEEVLTEKQLASAYGSVKKILDDYVKREVQLAKKYGDWVTRYSGEFTRHLNHWIGNTGQDIPAFIRYAFNL